MYLSEEPCLGAIVYGEILGEKLMPPNSSHGKAPILDGFFSLFIFQANIY